MQKIVTHNFFSPRRKRSISPIQGEQGTEEALVLDPWNNYSFSDSTGKKMKFDGMKTCKSYFEFPLKSQK